MLIWLERNFELTLTLFPIESLPSSWFYDFIVREKEHPDISVENI